MDCLAAVSQVQRHLRKEENFDINPPMKNEVRQ